MRLCRAEDEPHKEDDEEDDEYEGGYGDQYANIDLLLPIVMLATIFLHVLIREQRPIGLRAFGLEKWFKVKYVSMNSI